MTSVDYQYYQNAAAGGTDQATTSTEEAPVIDRQALLRSGYSNAEIDAMTGASTSTDNDSNKRSTSGYGRGAPQNSFRGRDFDKPPANHNVPEGKSEDTIYISGLPTTVTEDELVDHFKTIGVIKV
ncbi:hypothetical protein HDU96_003585 [Phlyctochytrium bullatum]|nr:hypothetical protein HDU96_003585 [Phlyctochytrium bullatum]